MTTLIVPPLDEEPWPTLGPEVCAFIEERLVYGPGDLKGKPYEIEPEFRAQLYRAYEIYPQGHRLEGRRRFKRVALSLRKGTAKTEKAMIVAACEAHPEGPVRCDGFDAAGVPVTRGVQDPYIPLMAYTVEQTEDLGFNVLRTILEEAGMDDVFDIGLERIVVRNAQGREAGKIVALAGSPNARDGARTTFQHFDETHRMYLPKLVSAVSTMLENAQKRRMADPWSLETTTSPEPGQGSVAENTMEYAEAIYQGKVDDPSLFFFHRQANDLCPMDTVEEVRAAVVEASGPAAEWSGDIDAIVSRWFEPKVDRQYWRRVWLNQRVSGSSRAFDFDRWRAPWVETEDGPPPGLFRAGFVVPPKNMITLGFDGARHFDATALIATDVESGFQWPLGIWERPPHVEDWEIPEDDVLDAMEHAFDTYNVWRCYADPPYWEQTISSWQGRWGDKRVISWYTRRKQPMAYALKAYRNAQISGEVTNNGDETFARHIGNAHKWVQTSFDEDGEPIWLLKKERADSPLKIDAAMAGALAWEARRDCIASGDWPPKKRRAMGF